MSKPSPIALAMDRVMRCVLCKRSKGDPDCRCWVTLQCPTCGRTMLTEREGLEAIVEAGDVVRSGCPLHPDP